MKFIKKSLKISVHICNVILAVAQNSVLKTYHEKF